LGASTADLAGIVFEKYMIKLEKKNSETMMKIEQRFRSCPCNYAINLGIISTLEFVYHPIQNLSNFELINVM